VPDILGGAYYGNEVYPETAPGGAHDTAIGLDTQWETGEGYLNTGMALFDAPAEIVAWGGSSDPYGSPMVSTSDIIRSRDAGIPYPNNPINRVPPAVGDSGERSGLNSLFKGVVDVFGKTAVSLAAQLGASALERVVPGRPSSERSKPGAPQGLPSRPYILPSFLGGGSFSPSTGNTVFIILAAALALFAIVSFARR